MYYLCLFGYLASGLVTTFIIIQLPKCPLRCEEDTLMNKLDLLITKQQKNLFTFKLLITGLPSVT